LEKNTLYLKQIEVGLMQNFNYLIGCAETKDCAVVDAAFEVDRIIKIAEKDGMRITKALLTHTHFDHMDGIEELTKQIALEKIFVHKNEAKALRKFKEKVIEIEDNAVITIGKVSIKALHTPGHLPGCVCFLGNNFVITGDTLFVGAIGRCDFPESDHKAMYRSLQKLKELPDDTVVYPGHDYGSAMTSTIGQEKVNNPYMRVTSEESFSKM
jgi:glyoxylase-like metal-dependent hydrolase (beta-lactamase superfamily II)